MATMGHVTGVHQRNDGCGLQRMRREEKKQNDEKNIWNRRATNVGEIKTEQREGSGRGEREPIY